MVNKFGVRRKDHISSNEDRNMSVEETTDELYEHQRIVADPNQALLRIDKFLMDRLPNVTRNKLQVAIKDGFVKVIFDAKYGEFLGAHMIGAGVTDMIAEVVVARKLETTGHETIKAVHPHPSMSEAVMEAAAAAYGEVIHL